MDKRTLESLKMALESIFHEYGIYFEIIKTEDDEIVVEFKQIRQRYGNQDLTGGIFRILESEFEKRGFVLSIIAVAQANTMHITFWYNPKFVDEDE